MNKPLQIGITGGIGSGKSTICRIFKVLGVPVYDADFRARELMEHDQKLIDSIQQAFGPASYKTDGSLDRVFLANAVFGDQEALVKLNALVHPRVRIDYEAWSSAQSTRYVLREAALLYESGGYATVQKMIVVTSPYDLRMQRVLHRDPHRSRKDIDAIMANQLSDEEKIKRADFIIQNDEQHLVIPQVLALHQQFMI
ncbi:MAG TPA: dephospho-CoA kinase [Cyclobacteriaceae bacterium]|nr:dephospho-CoA kinase [Cyclobacteriaceae bacterium]